MYDDMRLRIMLKCFEQIPRTNGIVCAGRYHRLMASYGHPSIGHLLQDLVGIGAISYAELPSGDDGYRLRSRAKWEALAAKKADKR